MSYCRFENTTGDMSDCVEDLKERVNSKGLDGYGDEMSSYEKGSLSEMRDHAQDLVRLIDEFWDIDES